MSRNKSVLFRFLFLVFSIVSLLAAFHSFDCLADHGVVCVCIIVLISLAFVCGNFSDEDECVSKPSEKVTVSLSRDTLLRIDWVMARSFPGVGKPFGDDLEGHRLAVRDLATQSYKFRRTEEYCFEDEVSS